eukprot:Rmarinus@m.10203
MVEIEDWEALCYSRAPSFTEKAHASKAHAPSSKSAGSEEDKPKKKKNSVWRRLGWRRSTKDKEVGVFVKTDGFEGDTSMNSRPPACLRPRCGPAGVATTKVALFGSSVADALKSTTAVDVHFCSAGSVRVVEGVHAIISPERDEVRFNAPPRNPGLEIVQVIFKCNKEVIFTYKGQFFYFRASDGLLLTPEEGPVDGCRVCIDGEVLPALGLLTGAKPVAKVRMSTDPSGAVYETFASTAEHMDGKLCRLSFQAPAVSQPFRSKVWVAIDGGPFVEVGQFSYRTICPGRGCGKKDALLPQSGMCLHCTNTNNSVDHIGRFTGSITRRASSPERRSYRSSPSPQRASRKSDPNVQAANSWWRRPSADNAFIPDAARSGMLDSSPKERDSLSRVARRASEGDVYSASPRGSSACFDNSSLSPGPLLSCKSTSPSPRSVKRIGSGSGLSPTWSSSGPTALRQDGGGLVKSWGIPGIKSPTTPLPSRTPPSVSAASSRDSDHYSWGATAHDKKKDSTTSTVGLDVPNYTVRGLVGANRCSKPRALSGGSDIYLRNPASVSGNKERHSPIPMVSPGERSVSSNQSLCMLSLSKPVLPLSPSRASGDPSATSPLRRLRTLSGGRLGSPKVSATPQSTGMESWIGKLRRHSFGSASVPDSTASEGYHLMI